MRFSREFAHAESCSPTPSSPLRVAAIATGPEDEPILRELASSQRLEIHKVPTTTAPWPPRSAFGVTAKLNAVQPDVVLLGSAVGRFLRLLISAFGWRTVDLVPGEAHVASALAEAAARAGAEVENGPPVSVVCTVMNERATIAALLDRLTADARDDDEIVVVDGGSADGTWELLCHRAAKDPRLQVVSAPDTNISAGRNEGVRLARHDVIACTDAGCEPVAGWLHALRRPFGRSNPPALVAGTYRVLARTPLERAQAYSCYPNIGEIRRPSWFVQGYARMFGLSFDPRFPAARSLAFTRGAWAAVGGFPEWLAWTEDGLFGCLVAEEGTIALTTDAEVGWWQRGSLTATARMYFRYGRGAARSESARLRGRDAARAAAYLFVLPVLRRRSRLSTAGVVAGAAAYLSLPVSRGVRDGAELTTIALIPVAMATKDLAKVAGALTHYLGLWRH